MSKRRRSDPSGSRRAARRSSSADVEPTRDAHDPSPPDARRSASPRPTKAERHEAGRRAQRRRSTKRLALLGGTGAVAVAILALISGVGQPELGVAARSEGGVGQHIPDGAALTQRNRPPSSGPHFAGRAAYGPSSIPVPPGAWIHALEHGAIVVLFKCADQPECDGASRRLADGVYANARDGAFGERKLVFTPYQEMDSPVAAVAWGRLLELDAIDSAQILAFYDRYVDRGPERAR